MKKLLALAGLVVLGGVLGFAAAGCGSEKAGSLGQPAQTGTTQATEPTGTVPTSVSLEVWFLRGEQLVRERRTHKTTQRVATAAIQALLAGPSPAELASGLGSAIPAGTKLLGISIKNGVATVDLTSEYQSDGGSHSMQARLGQVVYTLTQFPTVRAVRLHLDGKPVNVFSGEGIVLDHPVGRKDYEGLLPAISVENPAAGARASSPLRVSCSTRTGAFLPGPSRLQPAAPAAAAPTRSRSASTSPRSSAVRSLSPTTMPPGRARRLTWRECRSSSFPGGRRSEAE